MIYWDTSCLIKLYIEEPDSAYWEEAIRRVRSPCVSSALLESEMGYAFLQKELRGEIKQGAANTLMDRFRRHTASGVLDLYPISTDILRLSVEIARQCYRATPPIALRTLDGIHLATAARLRCTAVATADQRMRSALPRINLTAL